MELFDEVGGHPLSGIEEVDDEQTDRDRDGRRPEIEGDRLAADPPNLRGIVQTRDAGDERKEDERNGDHLQQAHEEIAEGLDPADDELRKALVRREDAEADTRNHANENPPVQREFLHRAQG